MAALGMPVFLVLALAVLATGVPPPPPFQCAMSHWMIIDADQSYCCQPARPGSLPYVQIWVDRVLWECDLPEWSSETSNPPADLCAGAHDGLTHPIWVQASPDPVGFVDWCCSPPRSVASGGVPTQIWIGSAQWDCSPPKTGLPTQEVPTQVPQLTPAPTGCHSIVDGEEAYCCTPPKVGAPPDVKVWVNTTLWFCAKAHSPAPAPQSNCAQDIYGHTHPMWIQDSEGELSIPWCCAPPLEDGTCDDFKHVWVSSSQWCCAPPPPAAPVFP